MSPFSPISNHRITRRRVLQAGLLGAAGLAVYASEIERHWAEVTHTEVALRGLPESFEGLVVVQLSDIHMDEYTEPFFLRHVIERINQLAPDIVVLTGDFVSDMPRSRSFAFGAAWQCANLLTELKCRPLYAILGNHDVVVGANEVTEALTANGITVLNNAYLPVERGNERIWLAGLDDPLTGQPNPDEAIPERIRNVAGEPVILMCHGPDYADTLIADPVGRAVSLMLSGHTHGGQVRLPFFGPLTLPTMGKKYVEGWFRVGGMQLYVNRGIGTVGMPFRFDCPPEITVITLRRA